jgi:hypothetical protein
LRVECGDHRLWRGAGVEDGEKLVNGYEVTH